MHSLIIEKLHEIEQIENVRILHAVESGSRAWGFPSPDSDYDVRFIYVRPAEYYLKLEKTRDVIELPINDMLDINGWDINKALRLLHSSNPTLFEWMSSPIVYLSTPFSDEFSKLIPEYFTSRKGLFHYLSMAETNYREYLKGDMVRAKKYFYVIRPILACLWILDNGTPPPMLFDDLVKSQLAPEVTPTVERLLSLKINSPEIKEIPRIDILNNYIEHNLQSIRQQIEQLPQQPERGWESLNRLFLDLLSPLES